MAQGTITAAAAAGGVNRATVHRFEERFRLAIAILNRPVLPGRPGRARSWSHPGKCNEIQQGANGCNEKMKF